MVKGKVRVSIYDPETRKTKSGWLQEGDFTIITTPPCTLESKGKNKYGRVFLTLTGYMNHDEKQGIEPDLF